MEELELHLVRFVVKQVVVVRKGLPLHREHLVPVLVVHAARELDGPPRNWHALARPAPPTRLALAHQRTRVVVSLRVAPGKARQQLGVCVVDPEEGLVVLSLVQREPHAVRGRALAAQTERHRPGAVAGVATLLAAAELAPVLQVAEHRSAVGEPPAPRLVRQHLHSAPRDARLQHALHVVVQRLHPAPLHRVGGVELLLGHQLVKGGPVVVRQVLLLHLGVRDRGYAEVVARFAQHVPHGRGRLAIHHGECAKRLGLAGAHDLLSHQLEDVDVEVHPREGPPRGPDVVREQRGLMTGLRPPCRRRRRALQEALARWRLGARPILGPRATLEPGRTLCPLHPVVTGHVALVVVDPLLPPVVCVPWAQVANPLRASLCTFAIKLVTASSSYVRKYDFARGECDAHEL